MNRPQTRPPADHRHAAEQARQMPGRWVLAGTYSSSQSAKSAAGLVRTAGRQRMPYYQPAGSFETRTELTQDGADLYVRYLDPDDQAGRDFRESIEAGHTESFDAFTARLAAARTSKDT